MTPRLRSPHRRSYSPSSKREDRLLRYLRPGALARLRDSRLSAKFPKPRLHIPLTLSPSDSLGGMASAQIPQMDALPCFSSPSRICGPRFPQRKKLVASKAIFLGALSASDAIVDVVNVDLLVAH